MMMARNMLRCADCTIKSYPHEFCPLASPPELPCGFDANEIQRRREIKLKYDRHTRTRRKFIGTRKAE